VRADRRAWAGLWVLLAAGGCSTGDDSKCEVTCQCEDAVQYRGAGYCDRDAYRCASGQAECEALCEDNGGLDMVCTAVERQPIGHAGPELVCPGEDPVGRDCEPLAHCGVAPGGGLPWAVLPALRRRRRR
jgi:hypothetical protein